MSCLVVVLDHILFRLGYYLWQRSRLVGGSSKPLIHCNTLATFLYNIYCRFSYMMMILLCVKTLLQRFLQVSI